MINDWIKTLSIQTFKHNREILGGNIHLEAISKQILLKDIQFDELIKKVD